MQKYSSTLKSVSFLYPEIKKASMLACNGHSLEKMKEKAIKENVFMMNSESRKRQIASIVTKRMEELDDFLARALLEGRNMTAVIITAVLEEKNKTEFNNLIYNKVEEDLIWIRMNGCIVGAVIGLIIFCGLELLNRM